MSALQAAKQGHIADNKTALDIKYGTISLEL